mgnify:CR=1 FL=1
MLYDLKWEKQTETKPVLWSMPSFIGWLEKMPTDKQYDFHNCRGACLLGQYMEAKGIQWWGRKGGCERYPDIPELFRALAVQEPRTFGDALKRARAAANQNT